MNPYDPNKRLAVRLYEALLLWQAMACVLDDETRKGLSLQIKCHQTDNELTRAALAFLESEA